MNQTQLKYARERAIAIKKARIDALRKKHTSEGRTLSGEEKLEALRKGRFKVHKAVKEGWGNYLSSYVTFNDEKEASFDKTSFEAAEKVVEAQFTILMDELILGDHETALKLLAQFEVA